MIQKEEKMEDKMKKVWNQFLSIPPKKSFGQPTRTFQKGDSVRIGNLSNCVVCEVKDYNGLTVYGVSYDSNRKYHGCVLKEDGFSYFPWYDIFELNKVKDSSFSKDDGIHIQFYNTTLESLLNKFYLHGVDMNPAYQRDYVWDDKDKESLLDSIFEGIEIGKFALIHNDYTHENGYEILDGKQRLSTLLDFYEDRLEYKGFKYSELSAKDKRTFLNKNVSIGETEGLTNEQIYLYFYKLNKCGKTMDEDHLKEVKDLLTSKEDLEEEIER